MKIFKVEIDTKAAREIRGLPRTEQEKVVRKAGALAENPRPPGSVKLGGKSGLWRIRAGDYRIIYEIRDAQVVVIIVKVGHRREVYRGM